MKQLYPLAFVLSLTITFILNAYEDTLVHHYDISIYSDLGHDSFWYPDWTRKYEDIQTLKRKGFWIFNYPAWLYDGWHLIKLFRYTFFYNTLFFLVLTVKLDKFSFKSYFKYLAAFMVSFGIIHWLFYSYLLLN